MLPPQHSIPDGADTVLRILFLSGRRYRPARGLNSLAAAGSGPAVLLLLLILHIPHSTFDTCLLCVSSFIL
eukprot:COSAG01_NODE_3067_length_6641_cov_839.456741_1_plen_71_part_00